MTAMKNMVTRGWDGRQQMRAVILRTERLQMHYDEVQEE